MVFWFECLRVAHFIGQYQFIITIKAPVKVKLIHVPKCIKNAF